jgi:uncharacterized protein YicC (UPF0701 family)
LSRFLGAGFSRGSEDGMTVSLDDAVRRLEASLGLLEAAVTRRIEAERRRGDLETELQIMQDDRARLAVELDGTVARLHRVEAAASDVGRRVERAAGVLREVLGRVEANGAA